MRAALSAILAVGLLLQTPAVSYAQRQAPAEQSEAYRAGLASAKRKGVEAGPKRQCYARVYAANAFQNQHGKWRTKKIAGSMWSECGIQY